MTNDEYYQGNILGKDKPIILCSIGIMHNDMMKLDDMHHVHID